MGGRASPESSLTRGTVMRPDWGRSIQGSLTGPEKELPPSPLSLWQPGWVTPGLITESVLLSHGWLPLPVTWGHCEEAS